MKLFLNWIGTRHSSSNKPWDCWEIRREKLQNYQTCWWGKYLWGRQKETILSICEQPLSVRLWDLLVLVISLRLTSACWLGPWYEWCRPGQLQPAEWSKYKSYIQAKIAIMWYIVFISSLHNSGLFFSRVVSWYEEYEIIKFLRDFRWNSYIYNNWRSQQSNQYLSEEFLS